MPKKSPGNRTRTGEGRFAPGQSGNPKGRPKGAAGLAALIRNRTRKGRALVEYCVNVLEGRETSTVVASREGDAVQVPPSVREKMLAIEWLSERGFGKAPDASELLALPAANINQEIKTTTLISDAKRVLGAEISRLRAQVDSGVGLSQASAVRMTECVRQLSVINDEEIKVLNSDALATKSDDELKRLLAQALEAPGATQ